MSKNQSEVINLGERADIVVGDAQFAQIAEQRDPNDRFISEVIQMGGLADFGLGDFIVTDILQGNTANIRSFRKEANRREWPLRVLDGTTDTGHGVPVHGPIDLDWMPIIPLKDDSQPDGYYTLPHDDPRYIANKKILSSLNIDFEEFSKEIIAPDKPGNGPNDPDFADYKREWIQSETLQEQYPTLQEYYDQVILDWNQANDDREKQTDVNMGMFTSAHHLDEASAIAWYFTMIEMLPLITFNGLYDGTPPPNELDFPPTSYMYEVSPAGNMEAMTMVTGFADWQHWIRSGDIVTEPTAKRRKYDATIDVIHLYGDDGHNSDFFDLWNPDVGDTVIEQIKNVIPGNDVGGSALRVRLQLTRGDNPTYGEIVIYEPMTLHALTGRGKQVQVLGSLRRWYDESGQLKYAPVYAGGDVPDRKNDGYSDIVIFPLIYRGMKKVPSMRRERLIRETAMISISYIDIIRTKWYQSRWFAIVMFVVSVIVGALTGGATFGFTQAFFQALMVSAAQLFVAVLIAELALRFAENPLLIVLLQIAVKFITKQISLDNFMSMASMAVEATGTYVKAYYANKMSELEEEWEDIKRFQEDAMQKLDDEMEELGVYSNKFGSDIALWAMLYPEAEEPDDYYRRTNTVQYAMIDSTDGMDDINDMIKIY